MKKCIKLLSCIMAFAIVMSMVVLPVSAASTNLFGGSVKYGSSTLYNKAEYSFTCLTSYDTMWVRNNPVESGKTYYFSYEVMIKNTTKSIETWKTQGQTITGITSQTISVPASTYYKFEGVGTAASTGNLHFGPRLQCADDSKTVYLKNPKVYEKSDLSVSTDATAEMAIDSVITYSFTNPVNDLAASNFNIDVDVTQVSDCVYTVAPKNLTYNTPYALTMTNVTDVFGQTIAENTVNFTTESLPVTTVSTDVEATMSINPVITYTFSAPADLAASNFDRDVVVTPVSDTVYTVALSGLDYSTAYSLTMSGVVDANDQAVEDLTINFTTEAKPVTQPVGANLFVGNGSYANYESPVNVTTNDDGSFTVTRDAQDDSYRRNNVYLEPGTYVAACKVKNISIAPTTGEGYVQADMRMQASSFTGVDLVADDKTWTKLDGDNWTTLTQTIVITPNADYTTGSKAKFHIGPLMGTAVTADGETTTDQFMIKDFQLRKVTALDLNSAYTAATTDNGDSTSLYISGPASTVYYLAAAYDANGITAAKIGKANVTDTKYTEIITEKGEGYKLFIWDSNMNPLNTVFDVSVLQ